MQHPWFYKNSKSMTRHSHLSNLSLFLSLAMLSLTSSAYCAIYKTIDENGNTVFTDSPAPNNQGEKIDVKPIQTYSTPPSSKSKLDDKNKDKGESKDNKIDKKDKEDETKAQVLPDYELEIAQPKEGDTFGVDVPVIHSGVNLNRLLNPGDLIYLYVDDQQYGNAQSSPNFDIDTTTLAKGPHTIKFTIENEETLKPSKKTKRVLKTETPSITINISKPTVKKSVK